MNAPHPPLVLSYDGRQPTIHADAWLAPTATVIGDAMVNSQASVFYGAVVRADMDRIVLGAGSNLQDNVVVQGTGPVGIAAIAVAANAVAVNAVAHAARVAIMRCPAVALFNEDQTGAPGYAR